MNEEGNKHSSVGRSYKIDQRATKIFLDWLPDHWLPRKQDPDFFVDYLVEIVDKGEPLGLHFAAQIKGYEDVLDGKKPLSYSFKTKHLKYYLQRSQHPVFLFLINVTTGEGSWLFSQKYLQESVSPKTLDKQHSLTVHFSEDDSISNFTKFQCTLPEAEKRVRDLHPGSIKAALQKRKAELEAIDPRCSVSISIKDGSEHVNIVPKEPLSFEMKVCSKNVEGWRNFLERGHEVKVEPGEIEIVGAPLFEDGFKAAPGGYSTIQFLREYPAIIQISCGVGENAAVIQIDGNIRAGTKYITFSGGLPNSPFQMHLEFPSDYKCMDPSSGGVEYSFEKWTGQPLLLLSYFDQISVLSKSAASSSISKMECLYNGNVLWKGILGDPGQEKARIISSQIEWLGKCRWLAQHFNVNPILPSFKDLSWEKCDRIDELYNSINGNGTSRPVPGSRMTFAFSNAKPVEGLEQGLSLKIEDDGHMVDFFGSSIQIPPMCHIFTDLKSVSQTPTNGGCKFVFETTEKTTRMTKLIAI